MNEDALKTWLSETLTSTVENAFFNDDFPPDEEYLEDYDEDLSTFFTAAKEKGIEWTSEDSYGGEGQGDDYWNVIKFISGNTTVYVKFDGWYQSYNGCEYTEWYFVEPKEVTVTRYFKVE